jgi:hypothetical protein
VDNRKILAKLETEGKFGRNLWGLLSLELWQQAFHDRPAAGHPERSEGPASPASTPARPDPSLRSG